MAHFRRTQGGFSLAEVVVAVLIMTMCLTPILLLFSSTRADTSRGVHRLRMMELANEAVDWIMVCPFDRLDRLAGFASGDLTAVPVTEGTNSRMKPFIVSNPGGIGYASDYQNSIKRVVTIKSVPGSNDLLKEAEVRITWKEIGFDYSYSISTLLSDESLQEY